MKSIREPVGRVKKTVAVVAGLLSGLVFYWVIEPAILGQRPTPLFDREATIFFVFKLFPLLIIPAVCLIIAALGPSSRTQAVWLAGIFASGLLLPVPKLDEWRTIPSMYGFTALSRQVLVQVVLLAVFLLLLAAIVAGIAGLVSPPNIRALLALDNWAFNMSFLLYAVLTSSPARKPLTHSQTLAEALCRASVRANTPLTESRSEAGRNSALRAV